MNIFKIFEYKKIRHSIPILFVFEVDKKNIYLMYKTWIQYIKKSDNIKILFVAKNDISLSFIKEFNDIYFLKITKSFKNPIDMTNILLFIRLNRISIDWIFFSKKCLCINIENIYKVMIKLYNQYMIYDSSEFFCVKYNSLNRILKYLLNFNPSYFNDDKIIRINSKYNILNGIRYSKEGMMYII